MPTHVYLPVHKNQLLNDPIIGGKTASGYVPDMPVVSKASQLWKAVTPCIDHKSLKFAMYIRYDFCIVFVLQAMIKMQEIFTNIHSRS